MGTFKKPINQGASRAPITLQLELNMDHKQAINESLCAIREELVAFEVLIDRLPITSDEIRTSWRTIYENARAIDTSLKPLWKKNQESYNGTKPESFTFDGEHHDID